MNNNPIDELRNMEVPVSEKEWDAIVHDKRYLKKFGRKAGLSPKGRAALIAGAAAVLITVPILIKTLSHSPADTTQDSRQDIPAATLTAEDTPDTPTEALQSPKMSAASETETVRETHPSVVSATAGAANREQSAIVSVTEARTPTPATHTPAMNTTTAPATSSVTPNVTRAPESPATKPTVPTKVQEPQTTSHQPAVAAATTDEPSLKSYESEPEADADKFFIPSAFTPNGDGLNDLFQVQANFVPRSFEMSILTRSGDLVFQSRDMDISWDGQLHGHTLPSGVYVYIIKYTDREGNLQKTQGQVLLLP